jgi:hypothetical protein
MKRLIQPTVNSKIASPPNYGLPTAETIFPRPWEILPMPKPPHASELPDDYTRPMRD